MSLNTGELKQYTECKAVYSTYHVPSNDNDNDKELWMKPCIWDIDIELKGLCQLCNPKSKWYVS